MTKELLQIQFDGWTATPRMPFVLSGNAICLPVPTYSILLGIIGCCLGRIVEPEEVKIGFKYQFDAVGSDIETRQRLEFDGKKIKTHSKGSDAYTREFHVLPSLTIWIDRIDWADHFRYPVGTPALGRSQDILWVKPENVKVVEATLVNEATISGCMVPFSPSLKISGQLIQLAEAFRENETVGGGRSATRSRIFMAIPDDNLSKIEMQNLYRVNSDLNIYLHDWR